MRSRFLSLFVFGVTFAAAFQFACVPDDRPPVEGGASPAERGYQAPMSETLLEEGRQSYVAYCVGCHGEKGDGQGKAAGMLHPKPRNFVTAKYKFSSRRFGQLPTDQDLFDTITKGLKGTSMPPWKLLPEHQRWALVAYIKSFSDQWDIHDPAPQIPFVEDPYAAQTDKSEALARGEAIYHGLTQCWTCHPAYVSEKRVSDYLEQFENPRREFLRDDLHDSVARISSEDQVVFVPDFRRDLAKAGTSIETLYRSISAGITGTAMPTWVDAIKLTSSETGEPLSTQSDLWALTYYVQSLVHDRPALYVEGAVVVRDRSMDTSSAQWVPTVGEQLRRELGLLEDEEEEEEE